MIIIDTYELDNDERVTKASLLFKNDEQAQAEFKALIKAACRDKKTTQAFLNAVNELDATL